MAKDLSEPEETGSFLVPAYEFERGSQAKNFDPDRQTCIGPMSGPEDTYGLIHRDAHYFQPLASSNFLLSASALYNPSIGESDRPFFVRLQERASEKPAGVRSNCLMVEGRRLSPRRDGGRTELVPSYAAWQTPKGGEPTWVSRVTYGLGDDPTMRCAAKTVGAHWSGQGALCAVWDDRRLDLLLVEFRIFDNDPVKPDLLKIWARRLTLAVGKMPKLDPLGEPLGRQWERLITRAVRGHSDECGVTRQGP